MRFNTPGRKPLALLVILATIAGFVLAQSTTTTSTTTTTTKSIAKITTTTTANAIPTATPITTPPATCQPTFDCSTSPQVTKKVPLSEKKIHYQQYYYLFFCALHVVTCVSDAQWQKGIKLCSSGLTDISLLFLPFLFIWWWMALPLIMMT
jgi:hypothetical protein